MGLAASLSIGTKSATSLYMSRMCAPSEKACPLWPIRGWRLSLAGAAVPALLLFLGSLALPDTPNSLLERGHEEQAHRVLARVRAAFYRYFSLLGYIVIYSCNQN